MAAFQERINNAPTRLKDSFGNGNNVLSLLEVIERGREMGERQRAWKYLQRVPLDFSAPQ
jgi:hypothetical protein